MHNLYRPWVVRPLLAGCVCRITRPVCFSQIHSGGDPANGHVGPAAVVSPAPCRGLILDPLYRFKDILIQSFVPNRAIVAFDIGVLLGLARLDMLQFGCSASRPDL